jgi:hypothetical protein
MCEYTMSRWRLLTGTSTGSQIVPPLWWRCGPVAPAAVEVPHERRAVVRGEDGVHPADLDVVVGVAGVLRELARRGRLDDLASEAIGEPHALPLDVGTGLLEEP